MEGVFSLLTLKISSYKNNDMKNILIITLFAISSLMISTLEAQTSLTATEIIKKADEKMRGNTSYAELKMKIIRPDWSRETQLKSWSEGTENALILVTYPARDRGTAFLKRGNEMWNWQPGIEKIIKLPPSMMMQSWMGSDFTNDDLVKQSSIVVDYDHSIDGEEVIAGRNCYKIILIPKEDAPVVWGKIIMWVDMEEFMQLKTEFYDEDDYLVNTMEGKNVKMMGGKLLPSILEVTPADEEGHKTIIEYLSLKFDISLKDSFFSIQQMKRVR